MDDSGLRWCTRFPGSKNVDSLTPDFEHRVNAFLAALGKAGATTVISATYRPPERAYLMHYSFDVAHKHIAPGAVPPMAGVDINWLHHKGGEPDIAGSIVGAAEMVGGYGIKYAPVLVSRHTQGRAIDMTIHWKGTLELADAKGVMHKCVQQDDLWPVGKTYGVIKLPVDPPHWSDDGH